MSISISSFAERSPVRITAADAAERWVSPGASSKLPWIAQLGALTELWSCPLEMARPTGFEPVAAAFGGSSKRLRTLARAWPYMIFIRYLSDLR